MVERRPNFCQSGWTETWQFTPAVFAVTRDPRPRTVSTPEPGPASEPSGAPRAAERPERIRITGRLAYDPQIQTLPSGERRVSFSLAEHTDDGQTIYHSVYSTKQFAERIAARDLHKGDRVELAGARQTARRKDRDGRERLVPVIYAYGVKPR